MGISKLFLAIFRQLPYKSDILSLKDSDTNMPHISFRNKSFLFLKIEGWNFQHLIYLGFQLIQTTFIFWHPMLLIEFDSISNMGCH